MSSEKECKYCSISLCEINRAGKHLQCRPCKSRNAIAHSAKNIEKRRKKAVDWLRSSGKVILHPCKTCSEPCYRVYAHAFCSAKCRFIFYIEKSDSCWLWRGGRNRSGYGKFMMNNKLYVASRASFVLFKGDIKEGYLVCHSCDNPPCVNPDHLWQGTNSDNQLDSVQKGRRRVVNKNEIIG